MTAGALRQRRDVRVVLVVNQFPAGSEPCIVNKFLGLLALGWDVHILARRKDKAQIDFFPALTEHLRRIHTNRDVDAELVALKPDLVNFEFGGTLVRNRMAQTAALGCRVVAGFRGSDLKVFGLDDPACYTEVWEHADAVHVVAEHLWLTALERGCPADKQHVVIPSALDLTLFQPSGDREYAVVGTSERPLRIASVGRLHWVKDYESALQTVALLRHGGIDVEYKIIGEGDHRQAVLFSIYDLGIEKSVELLGPQPQTEVRDTMMWADIFLHTALSEGSPNVILEAQAMGLPIVASDVAGLREFLSAEVGSLVARRNPTEIADRLAQLASDPQLRKNMGTASRERMRAFDIVDQIVAFDSLYTGLLGVDPGDRTADESDERLT